MKGFHDNIVSLDVSPSSCYSTAPHVCWLLAPQTALAATLHQQALLQDGVLQILLEGEDTGVVYLPIA